MVSSTETKHLDPTEANAAEMNEVMRHMELDVLEPYRKAGNQHAHELYANLPTPFSLSSSPDNPSDLVSLYDKSSIVHQAWNKGGALEPGQDDFFSGTFDAAISDLEAALGTSSMVTRWREAHPQEAGGDGDPVRVVAAEIRRLRGVTEGTDEDKALRIKMGVSTGMLLMRRAAA